MRNNFPAAYLFGGQCRYLMREEPMFKLVTDNTADLPLEYLKVHDVDYMFLSYT